LIVTFRVQHRVHKIHLTHPAIRYNFFAVNQNLNLLLTNALLTSAAVGF